MKVFISHSSHDKRIVRTLKDDLNENDIATWLDEDELHLGDSLTDSLEAAIAESSHFIIILSSNSVNSEWVQLELSKAIKQNKKSLLKKIIPIKLRECQIPDFFDNVLYGDLSQELVKIDGEKVKFITNGYDPFLVKLARAIKNDPEKLFSDADKELVKKSLEVSEKKTDNVESVSIHGLYTLLRYKTRGRRLIYAARARKEITFEKESTDLLQDVQPILLPLSWKFLFKNLITGSKITVQSGLFRNSPFIGVGNSQGIIAGYRKSDLAITLDPRIRQSCGLTSGKIYQVEFDSVKNVMTFSDI